MKSKKKPSLLYRASRNNLLLAFLFPFMGMLAVMLLGSMEPFGNDYAILYSDQYHQYYPFFLAFRKALRSGESLLYSWNVGMGMEYLGLISYYVASPLYLLGVLVPESLTLEYFSLLIPVRLGLAGLFFAIFLKNIFKKDDISIAVFGAFYGLCAWAMAYLWNVMWLDTFALLPLVALGTIQLLRDKKFILYTVALFFSIFSNYYIGFFTCIFVLLLFICYEICNFQGIGRFFSDLFRIALFSVLAIGMTAALELPTLAALQNTQSSVNKFPDKFSLNIVDAAPYVYTKDAWDAYKTACESGEGFLKLAGLLVTAIAYSFPPILDGMAQVAGNMGGALTPSFKEGLPNLYCGVGTIALAFLFLTAKEVKLRDKICSVGLLIFFMLSFLIRQLDYIWHGFHFTNMIPYRFSFLFSFVLLTMAYRAWTLRHEFKLWQFLYAALLSACILILSERVTNFVYLSYNFGFLAMFVGVFIFGIIEKRLSEKKLTEKQIIQSECGEVEIEVEPSPETVKKMESHDKQRRRLITLGATLVLCLELVLNLANFGARFTCTTIKDYPKGTLAAASMFRYINEDDSDFFRTEVTHAQTLNDGALNGYNGISTFTSSANVRVTEFMKALGYGAKNTYNRYCFEESSPVANLFLNLKYMVERQYDVDGNSYFDVLHSYGGVTLLENNAYLPLGFLAEPELADLDFSENNNNFNFQNALFKAATGLDSEVWTFPSNDCLVVTGNGVTISTQTAAGYTSYSTADKAGTLRYTYTVDRTGFMCLDLSMSERNSYRVYKNGKELYNETMSLPQMIAACDVVPGDEIEISITCKKNEKGTINIKTGVVDETVFRKGYDKLSDCTLDLTSFSNTEIEGTINCNRDGLLYTSVPFDGNWDVTVDGQPAEVVLVGDAMIALDLTEGTHSITLTYHNEAFKLGLIISLSCAAVFAVIIVLSRSSILQKGKYAKKKNQE